MAKSQRTKKQKYVAPEFASPPRPGRCYGGGGYGPHPYRNTKRLRTRNAQVRHAMENGGW
jgi:hypothetical protein